MRNGKLRFWLVGLGALLVLPGVRAQDWNLGDSGARIGQARSGLEDWKSKYRAVFEGDRYVCKNAKEEVGYNSVSPEEVLKSKEGECVYLVGVRWHGQSLSGRRTNLRGANLNGALLVGANFSEADLTGARLYVQDMQGANLVRTKLRWADFSSGGEAGAPMTHIQATAVDLAHANLHRARMMFATLNGAYLMDANLSGAFLNRAWLLGANLRGANLMGTDMTQVQVDDNTVFAGAKYDSRTRLPFSEREAAKRGMIKSP